MARRAERFCWRERSDKINWRMMQALDLPDVVRRGDPALLEPYALHLTFARLPRAAAQAQGGDRDAWFIVRILQLSMEYLLFMRSRDGDVLDSLFKQLQRCEQERDEMKARAEKWKGRAQSGERQVEKLHQVLQNIAKLLHIHGASPSAVATIETLLTELVVERRARRQGKKRQLSSANDSDADEMSSSRPVADNVQVCARCGKLFSSALYLEKHVARRHSSKTDSSRSPARSPSSVATVPVSNSSDNNSEKNAVQALAMQKIVQKFDQMLHSHEENFRMLSAQEVNRVQHLYEQFHVEAQLAEELKASRLQGEQELRAQREALEKILREKSGVRSKLDELKDEIQRLTIQHKQLVDAQAFALLPAPAATPAVATISVDSEASSAASNAEQEVTRLQTTLKEVSQALEETRVRLSRLQAEHLSAIREKQMLSDRLDQARDTIDRLEETATATSQTSSVPPVAPAVVSVVTKEAGTQASPALTTDATAQTDSIAAESFTTDQPLQPKPSVEETETQTETEHRGGSQPQRADTGVQASLDDFPKTDTAVGDELVTQSSAQAVDESTSANMHEADIAVAVASDGSGVPEYIQEISCRELVDAFIARSDRAAATASKAAGGNSSGPMSSRDAKPYSPIPRRSFLHSRFPHPEASVKNCIAHCLDKVDAFAGRFGVSSRSGQILSDEHFALVRQALHAHLEVLPTDVLDRMVECEMMVNKLIETEWVPREKTREQALGRFKLAAHAKSVLNQALVKQAMAAFAAGSTSKSEGVKGQSLRETVEEKPGENAKRPEDVAASVPNGGDSKRLVLADSRHDGSTCSGGAMNGDEGAPVEETVNNPDQDQGDGVRDDHRHDGEHEANDGSDEEPDAADTVQHLESEVGNERIHTVPNAPVSVSGQNPATGPRQIHANPPSFVTSASRDDFHTALPSSLTPIEQETLAAEDTTSELGCEAVDDIVTSPLEEANAVQLRDNQALADALTDVSPRASSPQIVEELSQVVQAERVNERDEAEPAEDSVDNTPPWMSLPDSTTLVRSVEELALSERSMSVVASSELSFAASVPSLESEDHREEDAEASRGGSTQCEEVSPLDRSDDESSRMSVPVMDEWETIESYEADDRPAHTRYDSGFAESSPRGRTGSGEDLHIDSPSRSPLRPAPADDSDDIEEIELA